MNDDNDDNGQLHLYYWPCYSRGEAFAMAHDVNEARELIVKSTGDKRDLDGYRAWLAETPEQREDNWHPMCLLYQDLQAEPMIVDSLFGHYMYGGEQ